MVFGYVVRDDFITLLAYFDFRIILRNRGFICKTGFTWKWGYGLTSEGRQLEM